MNAKSILLGAVLASSSLFAAIRTEPVNLYVSENGYWDPSGSGYTYTTIQGAVADATVAGDIVWVKDGFVCTEAATTSYASAKTMIIIKKAITLRSESGYVDEAAKKGATIRGLGETTPASTATRVLGIEGGAQVFGFVIEDGCSGPSAGNYGGGGIRMTASVVSNCVIRNCYGSLGGAIRGTGLLYSCVISNNVATSQGGGIDAAGDLSCYDCDFIDNETSGTYGGGGYCLKTKSGIKPILSNCTFRANREVGTSVWGGGGGLCTNVRDGYSEDAVSCYKCRFYDNSTDYVGGGARGSNYFRDCIFSGNQAMMSGKGVGGNVYGFSGDANVSYPMVPARRPAVLDHCQVLDGKASGSGGGLYFCLASNDTQIVGNTSYSAGGGSYGGGAYASVLIGCTLKDNVVTNVLGATKAIVKGGGIHSCWATNCIIASNVAWIEEATDGGSGAEGGGAGESYLYGCIVSNNVSKGYGGGVRVGADYRIANCRIIGNRTYSRGAGAYAPGGSFYNCLFAENEEKGTDSCGAGGVCGHWTGDFTTWTFCTLVNCTIAGNDGGKAPGGVNIVDMTNCVAYANTGSAKNGSARNMECCCTDFVKNDYLIPSDTNISSDPKFVGKGEFPYALRMHSPCKDAALELPWMSDAADPRSTALDGHARILGKDPDMGCYEHLPLGLLFMVK